MDARLKRIRRYLYRLDREALTYVGSLAFVYLCAQPRRWYYVAPRILG